MVEPARRGESEMWDTDLWIVTQSPSRRGSITVSHTRSMGASMSILAATVLMFRAHYCPAPGRGEPSPCGERFVTLPLGQRVLDVGIESVEAHRQQLRRRVVGGGAGGLQALPQRV